MTREDIYNAIDIERNYQDTKWGSDFDAKNTHNDWLAYIGAYLGKALTFPFNEAQFRSSLLKTAALCIAGLERESYAPTHYETKENE